MCLLITASAAVIVTIIWYFKLNSKEFKLGTLSLMYWGASIMWLVDGFFGAAKGEPFLDISGSDAVLGLIIVLCGLAVWLLTFLRKSPKKFFASLINKAGSK